MATVQEFEEKVWEVEGIRIFIRAPENTQIKDYGYQNAASGGWSTSKWLEARVIPCLDGHTVNVVQGNGEEPHGRTLVRNVKASYHGQL